MNTFYILFEEAEDGCYGDFLINRKLYTEVEMNTYLNEKAIEVFPLRDTDIKQGIKCCFKAQSLNEYGTGIFQFIEVKAGQKK